MLYEVEWAEDGTYVPGEEFSPERFFNDGLKNSTEFDLKLGYFSSAAISVLAEGFATFISRGGYIKQFVHIISSPRMSTSVVPLFFSRFSFWRRMMSSFIWRMRSGLMRSARLSF